MVPDALRRRGLRGAPRGPGAADGCAGGGHGDARAQRRRLEPRRPRGLHERLCTRLPHELRVGPPRAVRLAHPARPYVERSEAVTRILRLCSLLGCALLPAACQPGGDPTIALEGATLIDGSGGAPMHDALIIVKNGHIETVARVSEARVPR